MEKPTRRLAIGAVAAGASALVASAFCPAVALSEPRQRRDEMKGMKDDVLEPLIKQAKEASVKAYCPYSKFRVGAAVLTEGGEVFAGCNVENASYGLTICAERNAVFHMIAQGKQLHRGTRDLHPDANPFGPLRRLSSGD